MIEPTVSKDGGSKFAPNRIFNATLRCVGKDDVVAADGSTGCGHVTTVGEAVLRRTNTNQCMCGGRLLLEA